LAVLATTAPIMRAADESPAPILQWFDSTYRTIENRMPDLFVAGYGFVWVPPQKLLESSADSSCDLAGPFCRTGRQVLAGGGSAFSDVSSCAKRMQGDEITGSS